MVARIDGAFHHFGNGGDRYEIHNVTGWDLAAYNQAYKAKVQEFYEERPFAEERIVSRTELQADPFYIKYQNKIIWGSLALASSYAVYRFARPLFIDIKEAQVLYRKCSYYTYQTPYIFIMSGRGHFGGASSKSVPFIGLSFSPSSIRNGFIMRAVIISSLPLGLMYYACFIAPIIRSNLHTISFIRERYSLENEKRDDKYVCPISGKPLSATEGRSPIRFGNRLFDSDALVRLWLERGRCVVPEHGQSVDLYGRAARVFEIAEQDIKRIVDFRISMQEAVKLAVDKGGRFTQIAIDALGMSLKTARTFDTRVSRMVEEVMKGPLMEKVLREIPVGSLPSLGDLRSDQEDQWSDIFFQTSLAVGALNVTATTGEGHKIEFNPTCYVFDYLMKRNFHWTQGDKTYQTFLLKKKTEAFRDLKIKYIQSKISEEVLLPLVARKRIALFKQATGVNLGQVVEVHGEV